MTFLQIEKIIKADGWLKIKGTSGTSHKQYKHPIKPGKVTIPYKSGNLPPGTVNSILKQAGLK